MGNRKKLICLLEELADEDCDYETFSPNHDCGVCEIVYDMFGVTERDELQDLMRCWPEADVRKTRFSGYFIVPHPELSSEEAFDSSDMWEGEYGDARRRLCVWLVEELKKGDIDGN